MRIDFVLTWKKIVLAILAAVFAALAVGFSGLVSIAASSGHFAPVGWFLHWTFENAVRTQSFGMSPPADMDLSDPALVQRSAGHYATGCAPCHGAPGVPQSPVVLAMTPHPPRLESQVAEWKDRELAWIVLHGVKYSGMPAWPTQDRPDEVWSQVAFLRALSGMDAETYADLALGGERGGDRLEAGGEQTAGLDGIFQNALDDCARCHGRDGLGRGEGATEDAFPMIAGQPEPYLFATLQAFAAGIRHSGFMQPPAKRYEDDVLARLAQWYSSQPAGQSDGGEDGPAPAGEPQAAGAETPDPAMATAALPTDRAAAPAADGIPQQIIPDRDALDLAAIVPEAAAGGLPATREGLLDLGRRIAQEGLPARKIPACESCHGSEGREKNPFYPYLGGQPEWYARVHLHLWKEGKRSGTRFAHLMNEIAVNMTDEQIEAVAAWYAEQPVGR